MSKKPINQTLLQRAKDLTADVKETGRYSMSRIYGISNEITGKKETPQSCASCLIRKVRFIEGWISSEEKKTPVSVEPITDNNQEEGNA